MNIDDYKAFLRSKIQATDRCGFDVRDDELNPNNFPHQNVTIKWAIKLGRVGMGIELNPDYYAAGVKYCEATQREVSMPTLFDFFNVDVVK